MILKTLINGYKKPGRVDIVGIDAGSKGKGWHEDSKPTPTPKGIKNIAPRHHKAAVRKSTEKVLREAMHENK